MPRQVSSPFTGKDEDAKLGHRMKVDGETTYKKVKSSTLCLSIQMGIRQCIGSVMQEEEHDLLFTHFNVERTMSYPKEGSSLTLPHHYDDFSFTDYAPAAFRHFRQLFNYDTAEFMMSLCDQPVLHPMYFTPRAPDAHWYPFTLSLAERVVEPGRKRLDLLP